MSKLEIILLYENFFKEYQKRVEAYLNCMDIPLYKRAKVKDLYEKLKNNIEIIIDEYTMEGTIELESVRFKSDINKIKEILGIYSLQTASADISNTPCVVYTRADYRYNLYIENTLLHPSIPKSVRKAFAIAGDDNSYKLDLPVDIYNKKSVFVDIKILPYDDTEYAIDVSFHIPSYNDIEHDMIKGSLLIGNRHHEFSLVKNRYYFNKSPINSDHVSVDVSALERFKYCRHGSEHLEIVYDEYNSNIDLYIRSITISNTDRRSDNDVSFMTPIPSKNVTIRE